MMTRGSGSIQYSQTVNVRYTHVIFSGFGAFAELHAAITNGSATKDVIVDTTQESQSNIECDQSILVSRENYWKTRWPEVAYMVHQVLNGHHLSKAILLRAVCSSKSHENWNALWVQSPPIRDNLNATLVLNDNYVYMHDLPTRRSHWIFADRDETYLKTLKIAPKVEIPGILSSGIRENRTFKGMIGGHRAQNSQSAPRGASSGWVNAK
jgi:hypothetical protein